jgi:hypothetical protein
MEMHITLRLLSVYFICDCGSSITRSVAGKYPLPDRVCRRFIVGYYRNCPHPPPIIRYSVERARKSSAALGRRIDTFSTVVDMSGSGSSQKKLMNFAQMFATLDENHYPSTLGFCVILNTPWFLKTLFAIISPFLTAATRSKITLLGSDYRDELAALIDADQMPTEYGGSCVGACCGSVPCIVATPKVYNGVVGCSQA